MEGTAEGRAGFHSEIQSKKLFHPPDFLGMLVLHCFLSNKKIKIGFIYPPEFLGGQLALSLNTQHNPLFLVILGCLLYKEMFQ